MTVRPRIAAVLLALAAPLGAQTVRVVEPGPGAAAAPLARVLAGPYRLVTPDSAPALVSRDSTYATSVVVLGRAAIVEGHVHGDVVVVGGDLFMHPGAEVDGAAVAIGGGAYPSTLATVHGGLHGHQEFTYVVTPAPGGYALAYRSLRAGEPPALALTGFHGFQIPSYDRTDGLSLPLGALLSVDTGAFELEPTLTYRSQLGAWDPWLTARWTPSERFFATADAGRGTLSNDRWIWSDLVNSASVLWAGVDTRNYYRADRAQLEAHRIIEIPTGQIEPWLGARFERDWQVRPLAGAIGGPWSVTDRENPDRVVRPNVPFADEHIASALAGVRLAWDAPTARVDAGLVEELGSASRSSARFAQSTADLTVTFPTFGTQSFQFNGHAVLTAGDQAPPPRWAFLGGSGTFRLIPLMSEGGDELLYLESDYIVPIDRLALPVVGPPSITLRHIMGSAGLSTLPRLEQNLALRLGLSVVSVDFIYDATRRKFGTGLGLALAR